MTKLVVGCGYLGERVARRWQTGGDVVYAVTRSDRRADQLRGQGLHPIVADVTDRSSLEALPAADTVLYAVGFDRSSPHSMRQVYVDGLSAVLDALSNRVGRLIYISSTSVYGQGDGQWIDEGAVCQPITENGRVCLAAEKTIAGHPIAPHSCVLRLAGIYGPGRIPRRDVLLAGEPIKAEPDAHLNLIHVDDAATVIDEVARHTMPAARYLVSDGHPAIRREFYRELARLLQTPQPRFAASSSSDPPPSRGVTDKRISNRRLLDDLAIELRFPTYREGLAAIVADERPPVA